MTTLTTTMRWPLRGGWIAIVVVESEAEAAPLLDERQAHLVGCLCARCLDLGAAARPPAAASEKGLP
jgi:hypothetical protein